VKAGATFRAVMKAIDPGTFNRNSQYAHFGMAATIYLIIGRYSHSVMLWLLPVGVALAAWKEFYWDKHKEPADERGSDLEDFSFYCLGMAVALAVVML
jgi:hypothetical protein